MGKHVIDMAPEVKYSPLLDAIRDFVLDFRRPPTVEEVIDWAEDIHNVRISICKALELIEQGKENAGWKEGN